MPVDSLLEMARRACGRHSRQIEDIGDLPYEMVRPILLKIENPTQLYELEQKCPQIMGEDAEIWLNMIKRDIPNWQDKPHRPSNPKNWHKVYRKLRQEAKQEMEAGEERLKAALSSINNRREGETTKIVTDRRLPVPKAPARRRFFNNHASAAAANQKLSALDKIRKEARSAKTSKLQRPTHELAKRSNRLMEAPAGFVEDLRREKQVGVHRPPPQGAQRAMNTQSPRVQRPNNGGYDLTKDREARLRALKAGRSTNSINTNQASTPAALDATVGLNTAFLEDDDLDEDDDLFGELPRTKSAPTAHGISSSGAKVLKRKPPAQVFHSPKRRNVSVK